MGFRLCLTQGGKSIATDTSLRITLRENNLVRPYFLSCPHDSINSVMYLLDNSGSMGGSSLKLLRDAVGQTIDSLRPQDLSALMTFGDTILLRVDYTTDRVPIYIALLSMIASGDTPLWDAAIEAIRHASTTSGTRIIVLLTDGQDNDSKATADSVLALAIRERVTLYTIGVGSLTVDDAELRRLAYETGGWYYRVFNANQLIDLFREIRNKIISPCCIGWYESATCTEPVKKLHIEVRQGSNVFVIDTTITTPTRPDTATLRVSVPPEATPGNNFSMYVSLDPWLSTELGTSFKIRFRFRRELVDLFFPQVLTMATLCEGQPLRIDTTGGIVTVTGNDLRLKNTSGNLFGLRLKPVVADSSRLVPIEILSAELSNGCPVIVRTIPDTIAVCQCKNTVTATIDTMKFAQGNASVSLPIKVTRGVQAQTPLAFTTRIVFNAKALSVSNVSVKSTVIPTAGISWQVEEDSVLIVELISATAVTTDSIGALLNIAFTTKQEREPQRAAWFVRDANVYQRCCAKLESPIAGLILVDGLCSKVALKTGGALLHQNAPNPVIASSPTTIIRFELPTSSHAILTLSDRHGSLIQTLLDSDLNSGIYTYTLRTESLSAGTYFYTLTVAGDAQTRAMTIVK